MLESERIRKELERLGPEYPEDGIVRTILRSRIGQEEERERKAEEGGGDPGFLERLAIENEAADTLSEHEVERLRRIAATVKALARCGLWGKR